VAKFQRARSDETKEERRQAILKSARAIVDQNGFASLTVDAVAKGSQLAKGTLYIYFKTKEEILLAMLKEDFGRWFKSVEAYLGEAQKPFNSDFIDLWLTTLQEQPHLPMGMAYLHLMLEPNITEEFSYAWKMFLLTRMRALHYQIIQRFEPFITLETFSQFLVVITGVSVGLWIQDSNSMQVKRAIMDKNPELRLLEAKFETHFRQTAGAILESSQFQEIRALSTKAEQSPTRSQSVQDVKP
jgi:AcrR family transcriptional regulator